MPVGCGVVIKAISLKDAGLRPDEVNEFFSIYLILPAALYSPVTLLF
jgi:hypothetical protein